MCTHFFGGHHVVLGMLFGFMAMHFFLRARGWRRARFGGGGPWRRGPGGFNPWRGGDGQGQGNGSEGGGDGAGRPGSGVGSDSAVRPVGQRLEGKLRALDLNKAQRSEFDEVFARLKESLGARFDGWRQFDEVWAAIVATSFDRARVDMAVAELPNAALRKELADGIEHLHNILTDEQRGVV